MIEQRSDKVERILTPSLPVTLNQAAEIYGAAKLLGESFSLSPKVIFAFSRKTLISKLSVGNDQYTTEIDTALRHAALFDRSASVRGAALRTMHIRTPSAVEFFGKRAIEDSSSSVREIAAGRIEGLISKQIYALDYRGGRQLSDEFFDHIDVPQFIQLVGKIALDQNPQVAARGVSILAALFARTEEAQPELSPLVIEECKQLLSGQPEGLAVFRLFSLLLSNDSSLIERFRVFAIESALSNPQDADIASSFVRSMQTIPSFVNDEISLAVLNIYKEQKEIVSRSIVDGRIITPENGMSFGHLAKNETNLSIKLRLAQGMILAGEETALEGMDLIVGLINDPKSNRARSDSWSHMGEYEWQLSVKEQSIRILEDTVSNMDRYQAEPYIKAIKDTKVQGQIRAKSAKQALNTHTTIAVPQVDVQTVLS